jgi:hypothetical protein
MLYFPSGEQNIHLNIEVLEKKNAIKKPLRDCGISLV